VAFAFAYTVAALFGVALSLLFLRRVLGGVALRIEAARWRSLAAEAWPFWASGMLWLAYYRIDIVLLSYMSSDRQVGLYNMAYNGFQVLTMPATVLVLAIFPSLSYLQEQDRRRFDRLRRRLRQGMMAAAVAVGALSALVAGPLIRIVLGPEYADSTLLFRVLAAALAFVYPNYLLMYSLLAADRRRAVIVATSIGAAANVLLNLALIPRMDALGASVATLATESLMFCVLSVSAWVAFRGAPAQQTAAGNELAVAA